LWDNMRDNTLLPDTPNKGDRLRATFRHEFGAYIARRYFN